MRKYGEKERQRGHEKGRKVYLNKCIVADVPEGSFQLLDLAGLEVELLLQPLPQPLLLAEPLQVEI